MPDPLTIAPRSRIAYLSYSTAEFDSRTRRMAASAQAAGYEVIVYARWEPGLPLDDDISGVRLVRVPTDLLLAIPGLRRLGRRRLARRLGSPAAAATTRPAAGSLVEAKPGAASTLRPSLIPDRLRGTPVGTFLRGVKEVIRAPRRWWRQFGMFPL